MLFGRQLAEKPAAKTDLRAENCILQNVGMADSHGILTKLLMLITSFP